MNIRFDFENSTESFIMNARGRYGFPGSSLSGDIWWKFCIRDFLSQMLRDSSMFLGILAADEAFLWKIVGYFFKFLNFQK